ncbi:poly-beta-1,6-N-acetyl-D-glucosamine N-deacetylase PgaB [Achromobacter denitrificans]|uniref:poly-beta-1,6-N-acetyl-D-glucosamine N-deacetylase PgaB n=1 Tax=Achromobacter denitrificans TaxID=32002 RepID=UPI0007887872|nr:poly-beta-1,6-N-acetyl-D-glucosamine N-deacetylase PgaB [Achromobacter denitrificans]MDF3846923.1 poly-beta-1,6-N-acetyl-D-glucosamine N-deacetylase PgaB [Achromobacter denitrificans]MDF3942195.1 poly-beta-1,6-N-acetyl-D-glucosamine N-deacetylase PgaB [Achromobacter denitrificans]OLU07390.1 poly-beta-1,6-N-acetyl-D-glucosamine N-deacetylase [Achromobacter denitrificans]QKH40448.1 poly-beta-1,6-N-acetyl-D-glucosamine N-deacetylase PgaB [Achromobacter denitrificans]QKH52407.1 poly-beta-1,6-N-
MLRTHTRVLLAGLLLLVILVLTACAKDIPVYTPPSERAVAPVDQPWVSGQFLALAYHDVEDEDPDQGFLSVRTDRLVEQLAWLRENGYQAVSVDQILEAGDGGKPLPDRAVLLSFDDGYRSFYTRVLPILKAYRWPALLAPVGMWMDTPANRQVDFGGSPQPRDRFLDWNEIREISRSGLVEIAAHTDASHYGALANPQGNTEPAAAIRAYDSRNRQYETEAQFQARMGRDVAAITDKIRRVTGKAPRVWVWPYGAEGGSTLKIAGEHGYRLALTLEDGPSRVSRLMSTPRLLLSNDPTLRSFADSIGGIESVPMMRVAHVDLDYLYDPDPAQADRNLGELVQRVVDMQINTVFLQAFADPEADGLVRSVYFPNRWLPMRADLFNRVAWQLKNRAHVNVYAWMPVLAVDLDPSIARVTRWDPAHPEAAPAPDADQYRRLSPFDPVARQRIGDLYEDLARYTLFDGVLFHDDAVLGDFEDASPGALAAYRQAGLPGSIAELRADPDTMQRWTRLKSRALIDFTAELAERVRAVRGPKILTARNIFAEPILNPASEAWFAQNLDDFLGAYDWTAPMAMPRMENVPEAREHAWLDRLVDAVARRPGALDKTVFELQARDWRTGPGRPESTPIDTDVLAGWMARLQLRGARSFGYYPDDFSQDQPRLQGIRPAISEAWYPIR